MGEGQQVKANSDPFSRHKTRHRGVVYRNRRGSKKTYYVWAEGRYVAAGGTEAEAVAKQAELRSKAARGELVLTGAKVTFAEVAEQWLETKHRGRPLGRTTADLSTESYLSASADGRSAQSMSTTSPS
jgi:hypothetical protein